MKKYLPYILILAAFLAGNFLGDSSSDKELEKRHQEKQKLIFQELAQKQAEVARLEKVSKAQERKIAKLEVEVEKGDKKVQAIEKRYQKKSEVVAKYTPVQRDSFFYAKYPGQDTIRSVDSRKVMQDLVRGEGQDSVNTALKEQVVTLKTVIAEQKVQIKAEQEKAEKQKGISSDFERAYTDERDQKNYYQKREKKQRRKKNILGGALVAVIVLTLIK